MSKVALIFLTVALLFIHIDLTQCAEEGGLPIAPLPPFNCQPYEYSPEDKATNVNQVRPHDVRAVMALGDSMTAAFAATAGAILSEVPYIPREDRYLSYGGGGGSMRYTLPNFLKVYSHDIIGGAPTSTTPIDALFDIEPIIKKAISLNAAISGAKVQDIPKQVDYLYKELTTTYSSEIDFENDWKVITILIGANNLCVACYNDTDNSPQTYAQLMNSSIAQIYQTIPRVRLNVLPMFNISQVYYWSQTNEYCTRIWNLLDECPCLSSRKSTENDRRLVNENAVQYRALLEDVVQYWQSLNLETFAVTIQPFTDEMKIINGVLTSDFDCFHPSNITHAYLGSILWNSMLLPPAQKPTNTTEILINGIQFVCPSRDTYLQ